MMAINGRIQREGEVVHLAIRPPTSRGDEFAHSSPGSLDSGKRAVPGVRPRDLFVPDLHIDTLKIESTREALLQFLPVRS